MARDSAIRGEARSASDERAFREADRLLVAFGLSAIPATLMFDVTGADFLAGNFGVAGTAVMVLSGGASLACAAIRLAARRAWTAGRSMERVYALMCWPSLLTLFALWASMLAFSTPASLPPATP